MDTNRDNAEVHGGFDVDSHFRILKPIASTKLDGVRVEWMWRKIQEQETLLDDLSKDRGDAFIQLMMATNVVKWELGDNGLLLLSNIVPKVSAQVNVVVWDDPSIELIISGARELFNFAFNLLRLHRLSAPIGSFDKNARRIAILLGFKFEGEQREACPRNGKFHNLSLFGLLDREYRAREVIN